jgi:hypothetical protein
VIDQPPAAFVRAETATLREAFAEVVLLATPAQAAGRTGGNYILVAGDQPLPRAELAARLSERHAPDVVHDTRRSPPAPRSSLTTTRPSTSCSRRTYGADRSCS